LGGDFKILKFIKESLFFNILKRYCCTNKMINNYEKNITITISNCL